MFKTFTDNSTEPIAGRRAVREHLGETSPERRARIEALVARYPELDPAELADLVHWYRREASAMDVALVASNEAVTERFGAFCRAHVSEFNWRDKAITALLGAGVVGLFAVGLMVEAA
jgi:hypothetical protein